MRIRRRENNRQRQVTYHVGEGVIIKRDTADAIDSRQHADRQKNNQNRNAKTGRK
ncbi:hypothetical protein ACLB1E_24965 [Escherichia coli]